MRKFRCKGHTWNLLISGYLPKYKYPRYRPQNSKKVNQLTFESEDTSVPNGREKMQSQVGRKGGTWEGKWTGMQEVREEGHLILYLVREKD